MSEFEAVKEAALSDEEKFEENVRSFRSKISSLNNKFNLVIGALDHGEILPEPMQNAINKITGKQSESDFQIISLIRLLFLGDDNNAAIAMAKRDILKALSGFPFWPSDAKAQRNFDKIVFWSENHLLMTLGSAYLYHQYKLNPEAKSAEPATKEIILSELNKSLETRLLKVYLRAHCRPEFNGVYEVNSTVYLPYSLSALFNLYDFAVDPEIKSLAHTIIDGIIYHVMLCTTSTGVSNLSAGARCFTRTRLRTHGHNINQLINVILGTSPDKPSPSAITDYILTTTWRPNFPEVRRALEFNNFQRVQLSHPTHITRELYIREAEKEGVPVSELVPFYWSAGLVTHPEYVGETRAFQTQKGMEKNEHLSALDLEKFYLWGSMKGSMARYCTISKGQMYTDIELNVYKQPQHGLLLTSFEKFNPHCASFQQLPWIANVSGVGVWSQAGSGSESFLNFGMSHTHNPVITQKGSLLIASYVTPAALSGRMIMGTLFSHAVRLYWPLGLFEDAVCFQAPKENTWTSNLSPTASNPMIMRREVSVLNDTVQKPGVWCVARRGEAYIGVYCSQKGKMDHKHTKDAEMKETPTSGSVYAARRVCNELRHSWVVVVGSTADYPTLENFIDLRCLQMVFEEKGGGGGVLSGLLGSSRTAYEFTVKDVVEGELTNRIALPV